MPPRAGLDLELRRLVLTTEGVLPKQVAPCSSSKGGGGLKCLQNSGKNFSPATDDKYKQAQVEPIMPVTTRGQKQLNRYFNEIENMWKFLMAPTCANCDEY